MLVSGVKTRTGGQHIAPVLGLAFIDPHQAVAHRHLEVRRPQIGSTAELAVPRMGIFVRQQIAADIGRLPVGQILFVDTVLRRAVMLQPDATDRIGGGDQKIIMIIVMCTVKLIGLFNQVLVDVDHIVGRFKVIRVVGHDIQTDRRIAALGRDVPGFEIASGKDRRVDQGVVIGGFENHCVVGLALGLKAGGVIPARRLLQRRLNRNLVGIIASRIKRGEIPLQVDHIGRHGDTPRRSGHRRQILERCLDRCRALGHHQMEGVHIE